MAACGRCRPQWGDNDSSIGTINENLKYFYLTGQGVHVMI